MAVPDGVGPAEASFGVLGSVAMFGVERAEVAPGKSAAILGMGVVGQITLQLARYTGCEILAALDLMDMRLKVAGKSGATHTFNVAGENFRRKVREITDGRGLDVIIEASGALPAIPMAVELAGIGGQIVLLGSPWSRKVEVDFFDVHFKDLTILGCHQSHCPT